MKYLIIPFIILTAALSGCSSGVPDSRIEEYADRYIKHFKNNDLAAMYKMISEKKSQTKQGRFEAIHKSVLEKAGKIKNIAKGRIVNRGSNFGGQTCEITYEIEFEKTKAVYDLKVLNKKNEFSISGWYLDCKGLGPIESFVESINNLEEKDESISTVPDTSFGTPADLTYKELIFTPGTTLSSHAPCIIELPDGGLFVAWYATSPWGSDAAIWGSSKPAGADTWTAPFLIHDTPGCPDGNPVLYLDRENKLWLFLTAEKNQHKLWLYSNQFNRCDTMILVKTSTDFGHTWSEARDMELPSGLFTRNHAIKLDDGQIILPIYMDWNTSAAIVTSKDECKTWSRPKYILRFVGIQPTVIQRSDRSLFALTRTGMWPRRSWQTESDDMGRSWKNFRVSQVKNPGASLEMIKLKNGHVVLVFNDSRKDRSRLGLALSYDDGKTWPYFRVIEDKAGNSYPSIMQDSKGLIHAVYSYSWQNGIAHFVTDENWIKGTDTRP